MSFDKFQMLVPLSDEEMGALKASIAQLGVLVPIEVDEDGNILDGHHRLLIAEELGYTYPTVTIAGLTDDEKRERVLTLNMARRQLKPWQWGAAFEQLLLLRGGKRGRGSRNDRTSATIAEVAPDGPGHLGVPLRTAEYRLHQWDTYSELPVEWQSAVDAGDHTPSSAKRQWLREQNREQAASFTPHMPDQRARCIVIDPPWDPSDEGDVEQMGRANPLYATMPAETIRDYIGHRLDEVAEQDCHLYLWITNRSLPKGFGLLEAWGFRYVTILTWCKPSIGIGNYFRNSTEHVLFGIRGSLPLLYQDTGTWFEAPRGPLGHSSKPESFYEMVRRVSPGPHHELFARHEREGFSVEGAEAA